MVYCWQGLRKDLGSGYAAYKGSKEFGGCSYVARKVNSDGIGGDALLVFQFGI
jgi:hypothetical protein